jgi:hypothetical protein
VAGICDVAELFPVGRPVGLLHLSHDAAGVSTMTLQTAENLRKAIEGLINAKLHDALARPGGLERLTAHRVTGVASYDIRNAEKKLEQAIAETLNNAESEREAVLQ